GRQSPRPAQVDQRGALRRGGLALSRAVACRLQRADLASARGDRGMGRGDGVARRPLSALIPAARITSPQRAVSSLMNALIASGGPPTGVMLMARSCAALSGRCKTSLMARLSLATIAAGVFGGAASAFQVSERKFSIPASAMVGTS